jgi:DNA anti-recombination protein RmuC
MYRMDWSDDRLQERFDSIDGRFDEVDKRFEQVDKRFEQVDKRFDRVEGELHDFRVEVNARFDSLQRAMIQAAVGVIVALIGLIATQL